MAASSTNAVLDSVWTLLERGHEKLTSQEHWEAADCFCQAQELLRGLCDQAGSETSEDSLRIAQLYRNQANEYIAKARDCVIQALQILPDEQTETELLPPLLEANEEGRQRLHLLARLWASPELMQEYAATQDSSSQQFRSNVSLEQRLALLNQNLPKNLLSTEQRMQQVNKGLNRLGLSLYDHSSTQSTKVEVPMSEQDEVDAIIAQAKQEVALLQSTEQATPSVIQPSTMASSTLLPTSSSLSEDLDESSSKSSTLSQEEEEEVVETEMTPDQVERIRDQVASAQAELAQLLVLLQPDEGGYTDIDFDPAPGKHALRKARRLLADAAKEWDTKKESTD